MMSPVRGDAFGDTSRCIAFGKISVQRSIAYNTEPQDCAQQIHDLDCSEVSSVEQIVPFKCKGDLKEKTINFEEVEYPSLPSLPSDRFKLFLELVWFTLKEGGYLDQNSNNGGKLTWVNIVMSCIKFNGKRVGYIWADDKFEYSRW
jgi:hypothetical protein